MQRTGLTLLTIVDGRYCRHDLARPTLLTIGDGRYCRHDLTWLDRRC